MFCPQCGAGLGEGARGCAACGWAASRKTLWIVLGSIFGVLFLGCCGLGTFITIRGKKAVEQAQARMSPEFVFISRVQVLNFAKKHDGVLPESLAKAQEEPLIGKGGEDLTFQQGGDGGGNDGWGRALRYTKGKDAATYEVRSAGLDGTFDNEDDIVEKGALADDLENLKTEVSGRKQKASQDAGEEFLKSFGMDPEEMRKHHRRPGVKVEITPSGTEERKPAEGTKPAEPSKDPKEWGPKPADGGGEKPVEPVPPK